MDGVVEVEQVLNRVKDRWRSHTGADFLWHRLNDGSVAVGLGPVGDDAGYWRSEAMDADPWVAVRMALAGWLVKANGPAVLRLADRRLHDEILSMLPG